MSTAVLMAKRFGNNRSKRDTHICYTVQCVLYKVLLYIFDLGYQVPLPLLSVGYQNEMVAFVLASATRIKHFSFVLFAIQWEIIFRAAERPWTGWLAWRLSALLSALFCFCASDRLHQTERSQSRELPSVSLIYITPGFYHITGQSKRIQQTATKHSLTSGPSCPALLYMT